MIASHGLPRRPGRPGSSSSGQRRLHDPEQGAQDPVLVEAGDGVEPPSKSWTTCLAPRSRSPAASGSSRTWKSSNSRRASAGLPASVDGVVQREGGADLPQVLGVGPHDRDLAPPEPGAEHQPVQPVVLQVAAPDHGEGLLEALAHPVGLEVGDLLVAQPEVVDPDRLRAGRPHLVGALVDDVDAHVLQQRQDVGEGDGLAVPEQLEPQRARRGLQRSVQVHREVVARRVPPSAGCRRRPRRRRCPAGRPRGTRRRSGRRSTPCSSPSWSTSASYRSSVHERIAATSRASISATSYSGTRRAPCGR